MLFGQEQELLPALAKSHAEEAARADGEQALPDLIALVAHPLFVEWVEPDADAARVIGDKSRRKGVDHHQHERKADADPVVADAADVHHHRADAQQQHQAGKMRFLIHQKADDTKDRRIRYDAVAQRGHFVFLFGNTVCKVENDADLGELGGLELDGAETDPSLRAVRQLARADAGDQDEDEQHNGDKQRELCHCAIALVVDLTDDRHRRDAEHRKNTLTDEIVGRVSLFIIGRREAGGKQHDKAHAHEREHQQQIRKVDRSAARFARGSLDGFRPLALLLPQQAFFLGHATIPPSYCQISVYGICRGVAKNSLRRASVEPPKAARHRASRKPSHF